MNTPNRREMINRAAVLLGAGYRTTIVALDTGLNGQYLRELHKEVTGRPPRAGQLPEADAIVNTRRALVEGSLLMGLYAEIGGSEVYRQVDLDALSRAYRAYLQAREEASLPDTKPWRRLTLNEGWVLARDLRSRQAALKRCSCGCLYLMVSRQRIHLGCPCCDIKQNEH